MDTATKMMIEEFISIAKGNKREFKDNSAITAGRFMSFWSKVSEHTQSSISSLNCGTYKAVAKDLAISEALATQLTLVARSGVFPKRWIEVMQVVMYKGIGPCTMDNMRYLNMYEADVNYF